jgi:hypothetical protein
MFIFMTGYVDFLNRREFVGRPLQFAIFLAYQLQELSVTLRQRPAAKYQNRYF